MVVDLITRYAREFGVWATPQLTQDIMDFRNREEVWMKERFFNSLTDQSSYSSY